MLWFKLIHVSKKKRPQAQVDERDIQLQVGFRNRKQAKSS